MPRPIVNQPVVDREEIATNNRHEPPSTDYPTLPDGTILPPPYKSIKYTKLELFQFTLFHNKYDVMRAIDESQFRPKKTSFKAVFPGRNVPFDDEDVKMLLSVCEVGSDEWHDRVERIVVHKYHSVQRDRIYEITGYRGKGSMPSEKEVQYPFKEAANTAPCGDVDNKERQEIQNQHVNNKAVEYPRPPKPTTVTEWYIKNNLESLTAAQAEELLDDQFSKDRATLSLCTKEELIKLVEQGIKNNTITYDKFLAVTRKNQPESQTSVLNSRPFDSSLFPMNQLVPCGVTIPPRAAQNAGDGKQSTENDERAPVKQSANTGIYIPTNQSAESNVTGDGKQPTENDERAPVKLSAITGIYIPTNQSAESHVTGDGKQPTENDENTPSKQTASTGIYIPTQYPRKLPLHRPADNVNTTADENSKTRKRGPRGPYKKKQKTEDGAVVTDDNKDSANDNDETTGGRTDQNDEEKTKDAVASTAPKRKWGPSGPYNKNTALVPYRPGGTCFIPAGDATVEKKTRMNAPIQEKAKPPPGQEKPKPPGTGIYADMPEPEWFEHRFAFDLFRSRHNGANPSIKSDDLNERKLAKWARQQEQCRLQVIDGTADSLTKAKVESLRQIVDFPFFSNKTRGHIERLKEYKKEHGHVNVSRDEGDGLGGWLTTCRTKCRSETLDPDLKALLESMGWTVDLGQYQWEKTFEKMKEFKEKFGHCKVTRTIVSREGDYMKLYSWSSRQRSDYNDGKLSQECIDKLNSIGFMWKVASKSNSMQLLEQLKAFKEERGHFNVKSVDNHNLYTWVSFLRTKYRDGNVDETLHRKLEEIGFDWTKQIDNRIKEHLYELRAFKEEHGHCQVFGSGRLKLSKWLSSCKVRHSVGTLEKELAEELEEIGVEWTQWDVLYELLKGYYEQHGHCNLTSSSLNNIEYRKLRSWVKYQRLNYHEGTMNADRISKLEELGINWSLDDCDDQANEPDPISNISQEDQTEEFIKRLKAFKEQHGNCNISKTSDGILGQWVEKLRRKHKTGMLDKDLQARCEEIGLQWSQWDEMFKQLQEYKELHGDCHVPYKRHEGYEYLHLGRWCAGLRGSYRKGKLAQDRIDRLNEIGFVWLEYNPIDWADMLQQLREFKEEHGHPNVPKGYQPNKRLANFVKRQRTLYAKGQLKQERYDALDELGFTFSFK